MLVKIPDRVVELLRVLSLVVAEWLSTLSLAHHNLTQLQG